MQARLSVCTWSASARLDSQPEPDVEFELAVRARAPVALRRALARVAGRVVATRSWERLGFARLADYARERAGVSGRELSDLARVDAALRELPELEAAFLAGAIGWTQLRLVCRVASRGDASRWLELASRLSARALAREVRAVDRAASRGGAPEGSDDERVGVVLRVSPGVRARWWGARQLANRVAGQALSHAEFAEVLAAEVSSAVPLEEEEAQIRADRRRGDAPFDVRTRALQPLPRGPDAEPAFIAALERGLEASDAFELDARLRRAVRLEANGVARVAELLVTVAGERRFRDLGFRGLDAYAEERLGMSPARARALLRVGRAAAVCPELREAFAAGRLSWVQAHALVPLLLEDASVRQRAVWVEHAVGVSVRRLEEDVEQALATGEFDVPSRLGRPAGLQAGARAGAAKADARLFFAASGEVAHLFRAVLATVQRRLERLSGRPSSQSEALEAMLEHVFETWTSGTRKVPRAHRVFERDGWRCSVPGCSSYRNLHSHHIVFRSAGGSDEAANRTTLCAWHHLRGVHAGVVRCTGTAPAGLCFELGLREGHAPLVVYGAEESRSSQA